MNYILFLVRSLYRNGITSAYANFFHSTSDNSAVVPILATIAFPDDILPFNVQSTLPLLFY